MIQDMTHSLVDTGQGDPVDEMISAAVRGLTGQRKLSPAQVAVAAGISRSAYFYKLNGQRPWKASEVERLARFFGVSRDDLYEGRADYRPSQPRQSRSVRDHGSEGWEFESLRARTVTRRHRRRRSDRPRHLSIVAIAS